MPQTLLFVCIFYQHFVYAIGLYMHFQCCLLEAIRVCLFEIEFCFSQHFVVNENVDCFEVACCIHLLCNLRRRCSFLLKGYTNSLRVFCYWVKLPLENSFQESCKKKRIGCLLA